MKLLIPVLFLSVFLYAAVKKVKVYDSFVTGVKGALPLLLSIFPYIAAVLMMTELLEQSGVSDAILKFLEPLFQALGIPKEIGKLILLKPFSGSGSTALVDEIIASYGADSRIARCACVCYGSSETVFYIGAVYFSTVKEKKLALPIAISLFSSLIATIFGCFLCRIL